jgi:uncharacterized protein (TIGR03435 family)
MEWFRSVSSLLLCAVAAAQTPAFEVASVKPSAPDAQAYSSFPLGPGDAYVANGGLFTARGFPLVTYMFFAYKILGNQGNDFVKQLPRWAMTDHFDIQARAEGRPGKDDMGLMMRALLAERFQLALHTETREEPVLAIVLAKPGKPGPQLQQHVEDPPRSTSLPTANAPLVQTPGGLPVLCNGLVGMPAAAGRQKTAARNITMEFLANYLSGEGTFGRPVIDASGLTGKFDFSLEWARRATTIPAGVEFTPDPDGPTFEQALRDQLGLKLESRRSSIETIVLDHVGHPSAN